MSDVGSPCQSRSAATAPLQVLLEGGYQERLWEALWGDLEGIKLQCVALRDLHLCVVNSRLHRQQDTVLPASGVALGATLGY